MNASIVDRVAAWVDAQPSVSDRIDALHLGFTKACDAAERHRWAGDDAGAHAHEAAAMGILLALVREAWGDPSLYAADGWNLRGEHGWHVSSTVRRGGDMPSCGHGPTEVEALLAALESAP